VMFHRLIYIGRKTIFGSINGHPRAVFREFSSHFKSKLKLSFHERFSRHRIPLYIGTGTLVLTATLTTVYCYPKKNYLVIGGPGLDEYAQRLARYDPDHFTYIPVEWKKFPDGTDYIHVSGFYPQNLIRDSNILFVASFHNNDVSMSQYHALCMLSESFIDSMTILLPFIPHSTMERVTKEGVIATANTTARLFNNLPSVGKPTRVMVYDLHTLQNRFFFGNSALATLHTTFPLLIQKMLDEKIINCVAFPDDGAEKRFGHFFKEAFPKMKLITMGKKRSPDNPDKREIVIKNGDPECCNVVIVDDLVRSGGTLAEAGKVLKMRGASSVTAFVSHASFPNEAWKKFLPGGKYEGVFNKFWVTNSNPTVSDQLPREHFEILDIFPQVLKDL